MMTLTDITSRATKSIATSLSLIALSLGPGCAYHPTIDSSEFSAGASGTHIKINFSSGITTPLPNSCAITACHPNLKFNPSDYTHHPRIKTNCLLTYQQQQKIKVQYAPPAQNPYLK